MSYSDSVIQAESGGNPNSTNALSSASGPAGFINSTWVSMLRQHRPDIARGKSDDELLALKTDPQLSAQMADVYAADNSAILQKNGLPVTDGTKYLAHFAGPQGAVKILQADPNTPAGDLLGSAAVKANPFLKGMTAQGLQAWAAKKVGATLPNSPSAPVGQPTSILPPQPAPQFAQAPQMPAVRPAQAAPQFDPITAPPPPIMAQRPQIDLSGLRAALAARQPLFARGLSS